MILINYISHEATVLCSDWLNVFDQWQIKAGCRVIEQESLMDLCVSPQDDEAPVWWCDFHTCSVLLHLHAFTCLCLRAMEAHAGGSHLPHRHSPGKKKAQGPVEHKH